MKDNRDFIQGLPEDIQELHKRKRALERDSSSAEEWLKLAEDYEAQGYKANAAGCMLRAKHYGAAVELLEPEAPDKPEWWDK